MRQLVHIVEPTLRDSRGHTRSLVQRICAAGAEHRFDVWADRNAAPDLIGGDHVRLQPRFGRRFRIVQEFFLCRDLLGTEAITCITTAGRTELALMDHALGRSREVSRAFLYVHWLRPTPARLRSLRAVARRRPELRLGAATESVRDHLRACGFRCVTWVPYPTEVRRRAEAAPPVFRHLLYAGAARRDKGFHRVVDVVEALERSGRDLPLRTQTGGDYFGRMSASVRGDLERLARAGYRELHTLPGDLDPDAYARQFDGAICIQLYDPDTFEDRASGVTLDAFAAGAPVLASRGSWIAKQVERFGAGEVVTVDGVDEVIEALERIVRSYPTYADAARTAGEVLAREHDPARLVQAIVADRPTGS